MSESDERKRCEGPHILIVDDHDGVRGLLRAWLGNAFPQDIVMDVATGEEAVALAANHPLDLVLMDIQLPEMDGIEATRQVRAASPRARVVMLSSLDNTALRLAASASGASAYVSKHTMHAELIPVLTAMLSARVEPKDMPDEG